MKKEKVVRATIIEAARALNSQCDGAQARDRVGFNGADAPFAKSLLSQAYLTQKQLSALHSLLKKYSKQLATLGYIWEDLSIPMPGPVPGVKQAEFAIDQMKVVSQGATSLKTEQFVEEKKIPAPVYTSPPWSPRLSWIFTADQFVSYFPAGMTPRPKQLDALAQINEAFRNGKRVVVLEMPTGGGKSPICLTAARAVKSMQGKSHFLTIQKALQDQYTRDFPSPAIEVLKGRSNYGCSVDPSRDCANAPCTDQKKGILPECIVGGDQAEVRRQAVQLQLDPSRHLCPYWKNLQICSDSAVTLFNFSSFLFQQRIGRFGKRDLMIVDEAHNIEQQLMGFVSLELTEWTLRILNLSIDREITTKEQLMAWLREKEVTSKIDGMLDSLSGSKDDESFEGDLDKAEVEAIRELKMKLENFIRFLDLTDWIFETVEYRNRMGEQAKKIVARPLFANAFAQDLLFSKADRVLVMSATILDVRLWAENLGLKPEEVAHVSTPCDFPKENRPIHLEYAGNMGRKWFSAEQNPKDPTKPKFIRKVQQILTRHTGQRGLIHCQSFELSDILRNEIASDRFLFQADFEGDKKAMMAAHAKRADSVIVAPAMHEGFDFKDDLARFQIIAKTPWPSLGDKVIKERANKSDRYYAWLTALKLVQSYGRIVRSKDDWGYTYLIDSGFEGFLSRNGDFLPRWFKEAFQKYAPKELHR